MVIAHVVVATRYHPSEVAPEPLDGVCEDVPVSVLILAVLDHAVVVTYALNAIVSTQLISDDKGTLLDELLDEGLQRGLVGLVNYESVDIGHGFPLAVLVDDERALHHAEHGLLGLGRTSLRVWCFHRLVFPLLLAADVHLVALHLSVEPIVIGLREQCTNLVQHVPCRLLRDLNVAGELARRHTLLVRRDEVHGEEPLAKRQLGVLKDGASRAGEIVLALVASETSVGATSTVVVAAVRADHVIAPPRLDESLLAGLFVREIIGYGEK